MTTKPNLSAPSSYESLDTVMGDYFTSPAALQLYGHVYNLSETQTPAHLRLERNNSCQKRLDNLLGDITHMLVSESGRSSTGSSHSSDSSSHTLLPRSNSIEYSPLPQDSRRRNRPDAVILTSIDVNKPPPVLALGTEAPPKPQTPVTLKSILKKPKSMFPGGHQSNLQLQSRSLSISSSPINSTIVKTPSIRLRRLYKMDAAVEELSQETAFSGGGTGENHLGMSRSSTVASSGLGTHLRNQFQESCANLTLNSSRAFSLYGNYKTGSNQTASPPPPPSPPCSPLPLPPAFSPPPIPPQERDAHVSIESPLLSGMFQFPPPPPFFPPPPPVPLHSPPPPPSNISAFSSFMSFSPSSGSANSPRKFQTRTSSLTAPFSPRNEHQNMIKTSRPGLEPYRPSPPSVAASTPGIKCGFIKCFQHPPRTLFNKIFPSMRPVYKDYVLVATPEGLLMLYSLKGLDLRDFRCPAGESCFAETDTRNLNTVLLQKVPVAVMRLGDGDGSVSVSNHGGVRVVDVTGVCVRKSGIWVKGEILKWSLWVEDVKGLEGWRNLLARLNESVTGSF
ncbi:hypothetical protein BDR26DRAFT_931121 [Obelidium mucronatum]|nr:hypothetical protein BDR26DRAFT_931121 [Obelidium mucronatum]